MRRRPRRDAVTCVLPCGFIDVVTLTKVFDICLLRDGQAIALPRCIASVPVLARESDDIDGRMYLFERLLSESMTQKTPAAPRLSTSPARSPTTMKLH